MKWEYLVVTAGPSTAKGAVNVYVYPSFAAVAEAEIPDQQIGISREDYAAVLNRFGRLGWEMVGTVSSGPAVVCTFKREKP